MDTKELTLERMHADRDRLHAARLAVKRNPNDPQARATLRAVIDEQKAVYRPWIKTDAQRTAELAGKIFDQIMDAEVNDLEGKVYAMDDKVRWDRIKMAGAAMPGTPIPTPQTRGEEKYYRPATGPNGILIIN